MKRKERSWMYERLDGRALRAEYVKGVDKFIEFCLQHPHLSLVQTSMCKTYYLFLLYVF